MLQVVSVLFGCFMCFTHMLQVHDTNVLSIFRRMLHFYVANVLCCSARGEPEAGGRDARRAGGWRMRVLRVGAH